MIQLSQDGPLCILRGHSLQDYSRNEVKVTVTPKLVHDTPSSQDVSTNQIWDYIKRYAQDTIILVSRSEVKVKVTVTLRPQTKLRIPQIYSIGDMHQSQCEF